MYKVGDLFSALTGKSAVDCLGVTAIDRAVEKATGKKLGASVYPSNLVSMSGNIFPVSSKIQDLDKEIDAELAKYR